MEKLLDDILGTVRGLFEPLKARVQALEQRAAIPGRDGEQGPQGERGLTGPVGPPGERGPEGERGLTGPVGPQGERGPQGPAGPAVEIPKEWLERVASRVASLEARLGELEGRAAIPGPKGEKGDPGPEGRPGVPGRDGRDGVSIPGPAGEKGADGQHGRDGVDGLGIEEFDVVQGDDLRTFTFRWSGAGRTRERAFSVPAQIYRGVFEQGRTYAQGDVVTKGGAEWHANRVTTDIPGDGQTAWTLCVKPGREGKPGPKGEKGDAGRDGRDLTQMDDRGRKW